MNEIVFCERNMENAIPLKNLEREIISGREAKKRK